VRFVRALFKLVWVVILLLSAVVDWWVRWPRVGAEGAVWIHGWCRRLVRAIGVEVRVVGELPTCGAVVSNHLSYLDILLYSAVTPFVMVAKLEVRGWPLFGWLTSRAGTVYVTRRGGPSTYSGVNSAMAEAYRSGLPVLFFPEGTTTDGSCVLPFRRGLFHSVLNEGVPLRVAALRYSLEDAGGSVEEDVCWWGDALLAPHLWRLLGLKGIKAEICFGGEVRDRWDRFALSEGARGAVVEMYAGSDVEVAGEAELVKAL
jgi:1-acyl-sn-glycerol-3-phosphate acyltransferase